MTRRSPARLLAPLALIAVAAALVIVLSGGGAGGGLVGTEEPAGTAASPTATSAEGTKKPARRRKTYTVKAGDTPSGIAEKTGVSVEELLDANPDVDAQSLAPGDRLRIP